LERLFQQSYAINQKNNIKTTSMQLHLPNNKKNRPVYGWLRTKIV